MKDSIKTIKDIENLKGKRVLLRVDLNVPVFDDKIADDFRIKRVMPTIEYLSNAGARIVLISHMSGNEVNSLTPVFEYLSRRFKILFLEDYFSHESKQIIEEMSDGSVVLFENLRMYSGEKENDPSFAKDLASIADIYVNEAFSASHRKHASIVSLPLELPSYAGILFMDEIEKLSIAHNPPQPFVFILGGAKFETKLPLARKFESVADSLFLTGALSNQFFKENGYEIGGSLVSDKSFDLKDYKSGNMFLPKDVKVMNGSHTRITSPEDIKSNERIVDIGPETILEISERAKNAKCILWNGPVGEYKEGFKETSLEVARILSESDALTITGGGDTLSAISEIKVEDKFSFVSTAGGAMLDFLANKTLPGIEALKNNTE